VNYVLLWTSTAENLKSPIDFGVGLLCRILITVYGKHGQVHVRLYVNEALLWIHMVENLDCSARF
jgi:hypothetical protein